MPASAGKGVWGMIGVDIIGAIRRAYFEQHPPRLGEWVEVLIEILEQEAKLPRRERRSTQRLFEELRGRGYDGAHDSVHRFATPWRDTPPRVPARAYVPMRLFS